MFLFCSKCPPQKHTVHLKLGVFCVVSDRQHDLFSHPYQVLELPRKGRQEWIFQEKQTKYVDSRDQY